MPNKIKTQGITRSLELNVNLNSKSSRKGFICSGLKDVGRESLARIRRLNINEGMIKVWMGDLRMILISGQHCKSTLEG